MNATAEQPMHAELELEDVYREHHRKVLHLCTYLLRSRDAAEDAAHEVFLRAQRRMDTYDPAFPFSNWILKIASNHCIDVLRRRGTERWLFGVERVEFLSSPSSQPSPLGELLTSEQGRRIRRALISLPDQYRVPIVLAFYNEFSYDEIAAAMKIPRNTVATLLFRGKRQLRKILKKEKHHAVSQ